MTTNGFCSTLSGTQSQFDDPYSTESAGNNPSPETQYHDMATQTETSMRELFMNSFKRKWAISLAEQHMNIHPSFVEGDVILMSADDVGFRFPLAKLGQHSTFFRDLADLPRPAEHSNVIPLPDISPATMKVLLSTLANVRPIVPAPSTSVVEELVNLIDAYDFSDSVSTIGIAVYESKLAVDIQYAFACACDHSREDSKALRCLSLGGMHNMSTWARRFFENNNPEAYDKLKNLFQKWEIACCSFKHTFVNTKHHDVNDFGKRCQKGCPTFKRFHGRWNDFKVDIARALVAEIEKSPISGKDQIWDICSTEIACETCAFRMKCHGDSVWNRVILSGTWRL